MDMAPGAWQSFWRSRLFFTPFEKNEKATPPKNGGAGRKKPRSSVGGLLRGPMSALAAFQCPGEKAHLLSLEAARRGDQAGCVGPSSPLPSRECVFGHADATPSRTQTLALVSIIYPLHPEP